MSATIEELEASRDEIGRMADEVLARRQELRRKIGNAKAAAFRGSYLPPAEFRAMESEFDELGIRHQQLLRSLGLASKRVKDARNASPNTGHRDRETSMPFHRAFTLIAKTMLPPETYAVLAEAAQRAVDNQESGTAARLTGQVIPALATTGGMRRREGGA